VTIIIKRRNAYRNMQLCYVTNILTQWNKPCIWSGRRGLVYPVPAWLL